eukprot:TRINITY_DN32807_c0_g1_i1.p1 TRINITY_DN32807_c0_g1~~TRINITY_DN32807_c0_g1_i1.p1  ORF type:complete len:1098 (-),score=214.07 TRINITY_DN32807_c0_g1_i1:158-3451(-)
MAARDVSEAAWKRARIDCWQNKDFEVTDLSSLSTNDEGNSRESTTTAFSESKASILNCFPLTVLGSEWQATLASARTAIVSLRVALARNFQEDEAGTSTSTGFVVNATEGLILTNRHAISHGPSCVTAIFLGSEELPCEPVYADPVHDFAFVRYDPSGLCHTKVMTIPLCPEELEVGMEIRVVGNDDGEQHQVLPGIVARVDREVPECDEFSDENTFYVAAASNTAEGSSGSPVLNRAGHCVALNTATASTGGGGFFLPLERICRCLRLLLRKEAVPRGTLGACFVFRGLEEARRLGLPPAIQRDIIASIDPGKAAGVLVVLHTLRGSTAAKHLRSGDLLLELGGRQCLDFVSLEEYLDARVGGLASVRVCRGSKVLDIQIPVEDLAAMVPSRMLEFGFGVFHDVGYQLAAQYNLPLRDAGVFVARPGIVFEEALGDHSCVLIHVNGQATPSLQEFFDVITCLPEHEPFAFGFLDVSDLDKRRTPQEGVARMAWTWTGMRAWQAKGLDRKWQPQSMTRSPGPTIEDRAPSPSPERSVSRATLVHEKKHKAAARLCRSLALVKFRSAGDFSTELQRPAEASEEDAGDCSNQGPRKGVAIVLDAASGLCVADRATVPELLGHVELTFGGAGGCRVNARAIFLHPHHNFAFLRYDPADLNVVISSVQFAGKESQDTANPREDGGEHEESAIDEDEDEEAEDDEEDVDEQDDDDDDDADEDAEEEKVEETHNSLAGKCSTSQKKKAEGILVQGTCCFVGLDEDGQAVVEDVEVHSVDLPKFSHREPSCWRQCNAELVTLSDEVSGVGGVLSDSKGLVWALFFAFPPKDAESEVEYHGISVEYLADLPEILAASASPLTCSIPSLELELCSKPFDSLQHGPKSQRLPLKWRRRLSAAFEAQSQRKEILWVGGVMPRGAATGRVKVGDLLLEANGIPVSGPTILNHTLQASSCSQKVVLNIYRCGQSIETEVPVSWVHSDGAMRILVWAGSVLRETPRPVCEAFGVPEDLQLPGVFCTKVLPGSPAEEYGLKGNSFLRSAGGSPLCSLDDLLEAVGNIETFIRIETTNLQGWDKVLHVRPDLLFWPTVELRCRDDGGWIRFEH